MNDGKPGGSFWKIGVQELADGPQKPRRICSWFSQLTRERQLTFVTNSAIMKQYKDF